MSILSSLSSIFYRDNPENYRNQTPKLNIREYFDGHLKAMGIIQDFRGVIMRRFDIDLHASWDGEIGTLNEDFRYYDGETQKRIWKLIPNGAGGYNGESDDIIGTAIGTSGGNILRWNYQIDIEFNQKTHRVLFDDWMILMNDGVVINRTYLKKFGLRIAEISLVMYKTPNLP